MRAYAERMGKFDAVRVAASLPSPPNPLSHWHGRGGTAAGRSVLGFPAAAVELVADKGQCRELAWARGDSGREKCVVLPHNDRTERATPMETRRSPFLRPFHGRRKGLGMDEGQARKASDFDGIGVAADLPSPPGPLSHCHGRGGTAAGRTRRSFRW